jgi:putative oxidoreductase
MVAINVDYAPLALRIVLGIIFIVHGYPKLRFFRRTVRFVKELHFWPASFWAFLLGLVELGGGLAILLGVFSRIASGLLIASMVVATLVKMFVWKTPFSHKDGTPGWEFDLVVLAGLIALFFFGSGIASVDNLIGWIWG